MGTSRVDHGWRAIRRRHRGSGASRVHQAACGPHGRAPGVGPVAPFVGLTPGHIVHSRDWMASSAALPLCALLRIPVIDGTIRPGFVGPHGAGMRRLCMSPPQRVVANSIAGLLARDVPAAKGRVVYNGFDPERLALCEAKPERHDSATVVAMTGRMTPQKDFSTVIHAARELDAHDAQRRRFVLAGYGPDRQRLLAEARGLAGRGVTTFIDPGPEALPAIREAGIEVLM